MWAFTLARDCHLDVKLHFGYCNCFRLSSSIEVTGKVASTASTSTAAKAKAKAKGASECNERGVQADTVNALG